MNQIKVLVMDVDGTLTDGKVYMGANGELMKAFDIKDGYGIHDILPQIGIVPAIITGRRSEILKKRCDELEIQYCFQGISNKLEKLNELLGLLSKETNTSFDLCNVAYCGDDCNDLFCMAAIKEAGGVVGCPGDAMEEVCEMADFVADRNGGNGAVRAFIEWIRKNSLR